MKEIPVTDPSITEKEISYVHDAVKNAWRNKAGIYHTKFEESFAKYIGVKHSIATSSCTGALHLSLAALGIKKGDEVIVPDITWTATAAAVTYTGATPIFTDIEAQTWCLDPDVVEQNINSKTKAIIVVGLYGNVPNMHKIIQIAKKYTIALIEDAAEALGAEYHKEKVGSFGLIGTFSFHGTKMLTTGEGGMITTKDNQLYKRILFLSDHGREKNDRSFWCAKTGYKYKMSALQAALGLAQLERINELITHKRNIFSWYKFYLQNVDELTLNYEASNTKNAYWMTTIIIDKKLGLAKQEMQKECKQYKIDTRPFFYPLSMMPAYQHLPKIHFAQKQNTISYDLHSRGLNLPSGASLVENDVKYVCDTLKRIIVKNKRISISISHKTKSIQSRV